MPHANAGPDQASQTLIMLSFSGSSSFDPDGSVVGYQWTFGDGQSANGVSASHAYATPGTYTVTLTVTDNRGGTNSDTAVVTAANRPPVANAGPDKSATQGTSVAFSGAASSDPDGTVTTYAWAFGDGATGSGVAPSHTYSTAGTYTVTLIVADDKNATASDSLVVTVSPASTTWSRRIGASGADTAVAVATDAAGNVVVAGTMRGTVDFGGVSKTSAGGSDWFVAKYSPTNTLLWARLMGGTSDDTLTDVTVERTTGDIIAVGRIAGTANLGGSPLVASGSSDIAVGRYDAGGTHLWSHRYGGSIDDSGDAVAVDGTGSIVLTGYFRGTADFGTGPMTVPFDTDLDVFVAKLDVGGTTQWAEHFTNSGNDRGYGIAVDATGNIAVTGTFSNTIDFGGGPLTSGSGMLDAFVVKLSSSGGHVWSRQIGAPDGSEGGNAVAFDASGNVVLLAYAVKSIDAGGGTLDALGGADVIVAKYLAASGAHSWSRRLGGTGNDYGYGLAVDASGNVFVGGSCDAPASFGGTQLTPLGGDDAVVAKFGPTGAPGWSRIFGGTSPEIVQDVTVSPNGNPIATGYFYGTGTYGVAPLTSAGLSDGFLVSLAP
jgi:PKD repeat protein